MPAEWEPHEARWLSWPHTEGMSFPDSYGSVMPAFVQVPAASSRYRALVKGRSPRAA
jgi:agmatine deiminase